MRLENIESFLNGEGSKLSPKEFENYLVVINKAMAHTWKLNKKFKDFGE
jgi:hypothetical protein